eukprot:6095662-Alexandrium_andersonii.AAC.1
MRATVLTGLAAADSEGSTPSCRGPSKIRARAAGPAMSPGVGPAVFTGPAAAALKPGVQR